VGGAFLALAGIVWWRGHVGLALTFATLSGGLLAAGVVAPGRLGPVYRGWMAFAHALSRVTTPVFMAVTYYLIFAPVGFLLRWFGRNPIVRVPVDGSFWVSRPEGPARKSDLRRQF
jgi:hypothetical protein